MRLVAIALLAVNIRRRMVVSSPAEVSRINSLQFAWICCLPTLPTFWAHTGEVTEPAVCDCIACMYALQQQAVQVFMRYYDCMQAKRAIDIDIHTGGGPIWPSHRLWRDNPEQRADNES